MLGVMEGMRNAKIWQNVAVKELLMDATVLVGGSNFCCCCKKKEYSPSENVCEIKKNGPHFCRNESVSLGIGNVQAAH